MNTYKRYLALAATASIFIASLPLGAMKQQEIQKTSKISSRMLFLQAVNSQNLDYIKDHIDSMAPAILKTALEILQGAKESEVYTFIANYESTHSNTEKKHKRDDQSVIDVNPEKEKEIKKRKQDEETFLKAAQENNLKMIIANYKQMSDETIQKAIDLAPQNSTIAKFLSRLTTEKKQAKKDNANKKDDKDQETLTCTLCADEQKELECSICLNQLSNENNTEIPFVALPCDKKNKISHDFHIPCLSDYAKECKKNLKTMFPCPYCKKEYKVTEILSEEEIKKIEHLGTLIHKASTGNLAAAQEILENHALVTNENLATIFICASKNDSDLKIIKLFMANDAVIDKVGTANTTKAFIETLNHGCIKNFEEFIKNDTLFKKLEMDDSLKNIYSAIYKGNDISYYKIFNNILRIYNSLLRNFVLVDDSERVSIIAFSASSTSALIRQQFSSNPTIVEKINTRTLGSILIHAIKKDYNDIVQEFFSKNYIMRINNDDLGLILKYAAKKNNLMTLNHFLDPKNTSLLKKIDKKCIGDSLMSATKKGNFESIKALFESDYILKKMDLEDCKKLQNINTNKAIKKLIDMKKIQIWTQNTACNIQ